MVLHVLRRFTKIHKLESKQSNAFPASKGSTVVDEEHELCAGVVYYRL